MVYCKLTWYATHPELDDMENEAMQFSDALLAGAIKPLKHKLLFNKPVGVF